VASGAPESNIERGGLPDSRARAPLMTLTPHAATPYWLRSRRRQRQQHRRGDDMATTTATPLQIKELSPTLTVNDVQRSIKFFEGLGFVVDERWEEQGVLQGAMLRAGDTRIGLSQDDWKKGRDREKGVGMRLYLNTKQNIDELAARAKNAGVSLDSEPHDTEWGSRAFDVTEPSGFKVTIGSGM
jgi:uncharacterized glyoxalase superfamily protein PhnB